MDEEYLRLLDRTTKYMLAAEAMIDALKGSLGVEEREAAVRVIKQRTTAYLEARRELIMYARERERELSDL